MFACNDCRDLLLDHVYGLLDGAEADALRDHLAACADCRAAQAAAAGQQHLLAKAAQVYAQVPAFQAPAADTAVTAAAPTPQPVPAVPVPATLPLSAAPPRRRRWLAVAAGMAAAAAVVLAVWAWRQYDAGLHRHEADLARLRKEAAGVEDRYAQLCKSFDVQQEQAPAQVRRQFTHLQVLGPGDYQPGAANTYHVVTEDVRHQPRPARVTVRLLRPADTKVLYARAYHSLGAVDVVVPGHLTAAPDAPPLLVIEAQPDAAAKPEEVRQLLPVLKPAHVTHVVLNKTVFHPGEELFFRTLTLERFSLRPPAGAAEECELDVQLLGPNGQVERRIARTTSKGIASDSFRLRSTLPPGTYTLRVGPAGPAPDGRVLLPAQRQLTVLHLEQPQILVERGQYGPNEQVKGMVYGGFRAGVTTAGQPALVQATVAGQPVSVNGQPPGQPASIKMDASGKAPFHLQIPPQVKKETEAVVKATFGDKNKAEVQQSVKVVPAPVDVQLFPEGGDLVPGVPNRIYYRAQTADGLPAQVEGKLLDRRGAELAHFKTPPAGMGGFGGLGGTNPGLGSFQMTPPARTAGNALDRAEVEKKAEKKKATAEDVFKLVVTSPQGVTCRDEKMPVQANGVALRVDEPVCREGQPLTVHLRDPDHGRPLLVAVVCRGRLVAQQHAVVPADGATVRLTPPPGVRGVLRLTVYGVEAKGLRPLAERLVYCKAAAPLRLTATSLNAPPDGFFQHGQEAALKIHASDAREATVLAAVLDDRLSRAGEPGIDPPAAFFYLATELGQPEALEDAEVLLEDGPKAEQALDLFLGTQGWRRFPHAGTTTELALLTADNGDRVEAAYRQAVEARRQQDWEEAEQERTVLQQERRRRAAAAQDAAEALAEYQALPRHYGSLAAVGAIAVLFMVFVLGVLAALAQTARGRPLSRVALGGACGALLLGVGVYVATLDLRGGDRWDTPQVAAALLRHPWSELQRPEAPPLAPRLGEAPPQVVRSLAERDRAKHDQNAVAKDDRFLPVPPAAAFDARLRQQNRGAQLAMSVAARAHADRNIRPEAKSDKKGGFGKGKSKNATPPTAPAAPGLGGLGGGRWEGQTGGGGVDRAPRQYTYSGKGPVTDLLLWQPALTLTDGSAVVRFPLPPTPGVYRVLLYGNTPDGRLGFSQRRLEAK